MYEISRTDECTHSFAKTASEYLCRAGVLRAFGMATRRKYVRQGELRAVEKELALAKASVLRLTGVAPASYADAPSAKYRYWHGQYSSIGFCNTCMQCTATMNIQKSKFKSTGPSGTKSSKRTTRFNRT